MHLQVALTSRECTEGTTDTTQNERRTLVPQNALRNTGNTVLCPVAASEGVMAQRRDRCLAPMWCKLRVRRPDSHQPKSNPWPKHFAARCRSGALAGCRDAQPAAQQAV